jgi:hypothetical protein
MEEKKQNTAHISKGGQNDANHFLLGALGEDVAQRLDDTAVLDVAGDVRVEREAPISMRESAVNIVETLKIRSKISTSNLIFFKKKRFLGYRVIF